MSIMSVEKVEQELRNKLKEKVGKLTAGCKQENDLVDFTVSAGDKDDLVFSIKLKMTDPCIEITKFNLILRNVDGSWWRELKSSKTSRNQPLTLKVPYKTVIGAVMGEFGKEGMRIDYEVEIEVTFKTAGNSMDITIPISTSGSIKLPSAYEVFDKSKFRFWAFTKHIFGLDQPISRTSIRFNTG